MGGLFQLKRYLFEMFFGFLEKGVFSLEESNLVQKSSTLTDVIGFLAHRCSRPMAALRHAWFGGVFVVGALVTTGVAGGAVLRRNGCFDPGLSNSSAESLH